MCLSFHHYRRLLYTLAISDLPKCMNYQILFETLPLLSERSHPHQAHNSALTIALAVDHNQAVRHTFLHQNNDVLDHYAQSLAIKPLEHLGLT